MNYYYYYYYYYRTNSIIGGFYVIPRYLNVSLLLCDNVWMTHSDINKVKVISELLCIRHSYVNLDCFNSEDIDFMIEFMYTE